jgi:hypothetical protein
VTITWGLTGRGSEKTATVYCDKCREILESGLLISEARHTALKFEIQHHCKDSEAKPA